MNSFPTRKNNSIFAEIKLKYRSNDLFLFIEDEKMPMVYRKIITRLFGNTVKIGNVYSLKSKDNVLKQFVEWKQNLSHLNKCFFIVDRDFDHVKGKTIPNHNNLIELEYYTLENYLISKPGTIKLMQSKIFDKDSYELEQILNWETWFSSLLRGFKRLFIGYAIAYKYDLCENCGISPHRYLKNGSDEVNEDQVDFYLEKVEVLSKSIKELNFDEEFVSLDHYFNQYSVGYHVLIKGKYLYASLLKHLNQITGKKFDEDMSALILADNIPLNNMQFLRDRIQGNFSGAERNQIDVKG